MKRVLITGVSTGIGRALLDIFLEKNWFVYGVGKRCPQIKSKNFLFIKSDFEEFENVEIDKSIDIVVFNSGITLYKKMKDVAFDDCLKVFNVNMWGNLLVLKGVLKNLKKNSIVVFNSSIAVFPENNFENWGLYSSSKIAMEKALQIFSKEEGFRLLIFNIGRVKTPLWDNVSGEERFLPMFSCEEISKRIFESVNSFYLDDVPFKRVIIENSSQ